MSLSDAFLSQAHSCEELGSPFMGQLLSILARHWPTDSALGRLYTEWSGDIGPSGASLPLRIAGGLHALVLNDLDAGLAATYPPNRVTDQTLTTTVLNALESHHDFLFEWVQSPPQTNEVRRSAALIAAAHWLAARHPLPFVTSELGASAGLNLMWDRYALNANGHTLGPDDPALTLKPDWTGAVPAQTGVRVVGRRGVDLNPLNVQNPDHTLRLLAYLWADQPHRVALTRAAIAAQTSKVERGDAIDWLETRLATRHEGHLHLIYHTVAWQYFPGPVQDRGTALIQAAGSQATETAPLAWLSMESDGGVDGAALRVRIWPGDHHVTLGRIDFHGRWLRWEAA